MTEGFLILIGYCGRYTPRVYDPAEVKRIEAEQRARLLGETRIQHGMHRKTGGRAQERIARELNGEDPDGA